MKMASSLFQIRSSFKPKSTIKVCSAYFSASKNNFSSSDNADKLPLAQPHVSQLKRGTGGRSSFSGNVVTIFGASGMMGRILVNRLGKEGCQIIVPYRGDVWDLRSLKLCGDLGQILFQEFSIKDIDSIRRCVKHSNIVINCIGTDYETSHFSFEDVNIRGAKLIGQVARECGIQKLIHFSALNASLNPQKIYFKPSKYLITKYLGEMEIRNEFPDTVAVRPSNIYGESDRFLYYYANEYRRGLNSIPLWKKGEMTIKMPVHQSDVADGVLKILYNKDIKGTCFDFVGPEKFLLSDIVDFIYQLLQRTDVKRTYMTPSRLGIIYLTEKLMKRQIFNFDILEREFISDSYSTDARNQTLSDLDIKHKKFDEMVSWHLKVFNKYSYYNEKLGEFPDPKPPVPLSDDFEFQLRRKIRQ